MPAAMYQQAPSRPGQQPAPAMGQPSGSWQHSGNYPPAQGSQYAPQFLPGSSTANVPPYAAPGYPSQRPYKQPTRMPSPLTAAAPLPRMPQQQQQQPSAMYRPPTPAPPPAQQQQFWPGAPPMAGPAGSRPQQHYADVLADAYASDLISRAPSLTLARPSLRKVPGNNTVKSKLNLPIGVVFQPFAANQNVPVVNMGAAKVVRCQKCRAYINPWVKWTSNGARWLCNLCDADNETPPSYVCGLDATGQRQDRDNHPELLQGGIEFVASQDYINRPPMAPAYLFLMDVTVSSVQSGLLATVCQALKTVIMEDRLPGLDRASVSFITFDSSVHFYNIQLGQTTPHISVVPASNEPFLPSPEGILVDVKERKSEILNLLDSLPTYWRTQDCGEANVQAAFNAAKTLLRSCGGKIIFVLSSLPLSPELGLNPTHEVKDAKTRGSRMPDDVDGLRPSSTFFNTIIFAMAQLQISVDVIAAPATHQSIDLASFGQLARGSGGDLSYYPSFRPQIWGDKLRNELIRRLSVTCGWEGIMRVRVSKGWQLKSYSGNYCFRGVDLLIMPHFTEDQTVCVTFDNVDSVVSEMACYVQAAFLYTTAEGERRIRVLTMGLPTSLKLPELSLSVDVEAIMHIVAGRAMDEALKNKLADARSFVQAATANLVAALTISHPATPPSMDPAFPLDETNCIQAACLYCSGMLKSAAFREGKDIPADQRVAYWHRLRGKPNGVLLLYFRPLMFDVTNLHPQTGTPDEMGVIRMPPNMRLSTRLMSGDAAYLCCDGESVYLWIGRGIRSEWIQQAFGVSTFDQIVPDYSELTFGATGSPLGGRLQNILNQLRKTYPYNAMKLVVCRQGDPAELRFTQLMIEDKSHAIGISFFDIWNKFAASRPSMGLGNPPQTFPNMYR